MRVTVLGSGTGVPVPDRHSAGLLIEIGDERVLCDAGPGTLQQAAKRGVAHLTVDRVFLTHYHPDHCLDLVSILFAMRIPEPPRHRPLALYGPRGLRRLSRGLDAAFHGWLRPKGYRLSLRELAAARLDLPGYRVMTMPMRHSTAAIGYRFEAGGKAIAYSGDTDYGPGVVELGRRADLLILECSMTDERKVAGHLTPTECGRIAAEAGCRHLLLTHFYPVFEGYDIRRRVRRAFRGCLTLARDFSTFVV